MEQKKLNSTTNNPWQPPLWKMPSQKSFIDQAAASAAPYLTAMSNHLFMQQLIAGTLDIDKAKFYTAQLAYYLEDISAALATVAGRDKNLLRPFLQFSSYVLFSLQANFADFYPGQKPAQSSVGEQYIDYMRLTAHEAQVEVSVATLLASCWMHLQLALYLRQQTIAPNNPYKPWIDMFCDPSFDAVAQQAIDATNQMATMVTSDQRSQMLANFLKSSELELNLLDSSYNLQNKLREAGVTLTPTPLHVVPNYHM